MTTLAEALAELASATSLQDVETIANSLSADAVNPDVGGILYSGEVGDAAAEDVALTTSDETGLNIINSTVRAQFLKSPAVTRNLARIYQASESPTSAAEITQLVKTALYEGPNSLWGQASSTFVGSLKGSVTVIATDAANPSGVLSTTEINAILSNSGITSVNGIARAKLPTTASGLLAVAKSSFIGANAAGGVFTKVVDGVTTSVLSSETLGALKLPTQGTFTAAELIKEGFTASLTPGLETVAATEAESLLAIFGKGAFGLLTSAVAGGIIDLLANSKPLNVGEDQAIAQLNAAYLDTAAANLDQSEMTDVNGVTTVDCPLTSSNGATNDDFFLIANPNADSAILGVVTNNDSTLTISSDIDGVQVSDDQITDDTANQTYDGQITVDPYSDAAPAFSVTIELGGIATVDKDLTVLGVRQNFVFAGNSGTLIIDEPSSFTGTISDLQAGDIVDLTSVGSVSGAELSADNGLTLQQSDGNIVILNLDTSDDYAEKEFLVEPDGSGGSSVILETAMPGQPFNFMGPGELLLFSEFNYYDPLMSGFEPGDTIDFVGVDTLATVTAAADSNNDNYLIEASNGVRSFQLDPAEDYSRDSMFIRSDGSSGLDISSVSDSQNVTFTSTNQELLINDAASFTGVLSDFQAGDILDVTGFSPTRAVIGSGGDLELLAANGSVVASLELANPQSYNEDSFTVLNVFNGGTDITVGPELRVSGSDTVTVYQTDFDPVTGKVGTYSATVGITPGTVYLNAARVGYPEAFPSIVVTYLGGNPDPNAVLDSIEVSGYPSSEYDFTSVSGLGPSILTGTIYGSYNPSETGQTVSGALTVSYDGNSVTTEIASPPEKVYETARATFSIAGVSMPIYDFGILHVGQTASISVAITNVANIGLTDGLSSSIQTIGEFTATNNISNLAEGQTGTVTLQLNAASSGYEDVGAAQIFGLTSQDPDLPNVAAVSSNLGFVAEVYNYAIPYLLDISNGHSSDQSGELTQTGNGSWVLDFGTIITTDPTSYVSDVFVENIANDSGLATSDALGGSFAVTGYGFTYNVNNEISPSVVAGSDGVFGSFSPDFASLGANTLTVTYYPTSIDSAGATDLSPITLTVIDDVLLCFASGTRIATTKGEIPIEKVTVGDVLKAYTSGKAAVQWIGHRRVNCLRHPKPQEVWPVRIRAGAFAKNKPRSDLWLSPEHSIFAEGVLIPIRYLINGTTIVQEPRDEVTYWVVELPRHDLVVAEGLLCESYLDAGHRNAFMADRGPIQMHPTFSFEQNCEAIWESRGFAPLRICGEAVTRVAALLHRRAKALGLSVEGRVAGIQKVSAATKNFAKLFQPAWYREREKDVAAAGVDPTTHYREWGRQEGRLPCAEVELLRALQVIDPATIVFTMSDVIRAGVDPVMHFCGEGWRERRNPNPYFDTGWYLDTHHVPEGMNPLLHYLLVGERKGLAPSKHFDPSWYRKRYAIDPMESPLAHYLEHRRSQCFSPLPSFDAATYCQEHVATLLPNRDPFAHYIAIGQFAKSEGKDFERAAA